MIAKAAIPVLLAICLISTAIWPAMADSEPVIFSGWVSNGDVKPANGYYVWFGVANNSSTIKVTVNRPGTTDDEFYISPGNYKNYPGVIRITLVKKEASADQAYVEIASLSGGSSSSSGGTHLTCDAPGQTALAGDKVTFPITITNNGDGDRTYTLSSATDTGWSLGFTYGSMGVYKINVPKSQSKVVNFEVHTSSITGVGEHKVTAKVDDASIDLYVYITSVNQTVDVSADISSKIAAIGDKIYYNINLKNLQPNENIYGLSVSGLPDSWYYRFKETTTSTEEMAQVVVPATAEKSMVLEIVPSYNVAEGDYNFTATVTTPDGVNINKSLSLKLKSGSGMSVTSSMLAYEAKPGQAFDIVVYVTNNGRGAALTNVYLDAKAPDGWTIDVSPNQTNSIKAGESQKFTITVVPPGNIVASDYEVDVNVKSDQVESDKVYRITIKTESYIPYIGGALILIVLAGLAFMYKKYGRR